MALCWMGWRKCGTVLVPRKTAPGFSMFTRTFEFGNRASNGRIYDTAEVNKRPDLHLAVKSANYAPPTHTP